MFQGVQPIKNIFKKNMYSQKNSQRTTKQGKNFQKFIIILVVTQKVTHLLCS